MVMWLNDRHILRWLECHTWSDFSNHLTVRVCLALEDFAAHDLGRERLRDEAWEGETAADAEEKEKEGEDSGDLATFSTLLNCVESSDPRNHRFVRSLLQSMLSLFREKGEPVNTEQARIKKLNSIC